MKIEQIDANFAVKSVDNGSKKDYYRIPDDKFALFGLKYSDEDGFYRVPKEVAEKTNPGVVSLRKNTSGGRLCFSTDSDYFSMTAKYGYLWDSSHIPLSGSSGFSLLEITDGDCRFVAELRPQHGEDKGFFAECRLGGGKMRDYALYFPLYTDVDDLVVGLKKDSAVIKFSPYKDVLPVVYYGSSITQGACASRPDNCYQAYVSKWTNVDYLNFGFSGSAKAEDAICDFLSGIPASVFVMDYDHNAPNAEYLKSTHYNFYKKYRLANPDTPILFISRPDYDSDKKDGEARLKVIKSTFLRAKREGDQNVSLLNGKLLFGKFDRENCFVDGIHPNDLGFYRMAKLVFRSIKNIRPDF